MDGRHFVYYFRLKTNGVKSKLKDSFTIKCVPIQLTILLVPINKHLSKFDTRIVENNSFNLIFSKFDSDSMHYQM